MARISTGNPHTTLVLQAGSEFTTTQHGFDTGTRTFKCDTTVAARLEPREGVSDRDISFSDGTKIIRGVYPWMFVTTVVVVEEELGMVTMRVSYRGQKTVGTLKLKEAHYEFANEQKQIDAGGVQINLALPVAQKTYLAKTLAELPAMNSPVSAPPGFAAPSLTYEGITIPTPEYAGWRITGRNHATAGRAAGKQLFEVHDTYSYQLGIGA